MSKILVTGGNGQLGMEFLQISGKYPEHEFVFTDVEELDLTDSLEVKRFFKSNSFDICINCAGYTAVDQAEKETELAMNINKDAVAYLSMECDLQNCFLFHLSTDYVFDGTKHKPYLETDIPAPNTAYGNSKLAGEKMLMEKGSNWMIIRTSWLYSSFGNNFVKTIRRLALERETLKVVNDQIGSPTYAGDLATAIMKIIPKLNSNVSNQVYHFCNDGVASWYDFAKVIVSHLKTNCRVETIESSDYPMLANRPFYSVLNNNKIKSAFGITIPYWQDSLQIVMNQLAENKN